MKGSITVYDSRNHRWILSDSADSDQFSLPASTFKIVHLLIALEAKVIGGVQDTVRWTGHTDTSLYGYRPEIYRDMTVADAFRFSAGWVFIELAKKIGRTRYHRYLNACRYGNGNLAEKDVDFWNFGGFAVSPRQQVSFLVRLHDNRLPFSRKNMDAVKKVMINDSDTNIILRAKTGWTRTAGQDLGWWIGYYENGRDVIYFATRVMKPRSEMNARFGECRKTITRNILGQLHMLPRNAFTAF